jgi:hypothetical protein
MYSHGDWVFVGFRKQGEYVVVASTDLVNLQLTARMESEFEIRRDYHQVYAHYETTYEVEGEMRSLVMAVGANYEEALRRVMDLLARDGRAWYDPPPRERQGLGTGLPELEEGQDEAGT